MDGAARHWAGLVPEPARLYMHRRACSEQSCEGKDALQTHEESRPYPLPIGML
jgi:hypothetical protein